MRDELGILKEVGSIAAAHGSIALSEMLGRRINLTVPKVSVVSPGSLQEKIGLKRMGIAIVANLPTGLKGDSIFLLDETNAFKLIDMSYKIREEDKKSGTFTEIGISSIKEIGTIVIGSYLSAISLMLKRVVLSLPPTLISGSVDEILNLVISVSGRKNHALLIEVSFREPQEEIKGVFYLVLTPKTAAEILKACKKMLKELEKEK